MLTERMSKIVLHVLKQDVDVVLEYFGRHDCIQFIEKTAHESADRVESAGGMKSRLEALRTYFAYKPGREAELSPQGSGPSLPGETEFARARELIEKSETLISEEQEITARKLQGEQALEEASTFAKLNVPFRELEHLTFLTFRYGRIDRAKFGSLTQALTGRAIVIGSDESDRVLAVASKKGRWALDTELRNAGFREIPYPEDYSGVPSEMTAGLERERQEVTAAYEDFIRNRERLADLIRNDLDTLIERFRIASMVEEVRRELPSSRAVYRITGWIPSGRMQETVADLDRLTGGRMAARVLKPSEVPEVQAGTVKVPVKLRHSGLVRAFEGLVFSYGAPLYGTIDPTVFVALLFVVLFAVMFGDVGQGFIGLLFGIILKRGKVAGLRKYAKFGIIFIAVGIASMFTGLLYGSVFANEHMLVPFTRKISAFLTGNPVDRFVAVMPSGSLDQLFMFFGFTIGLGVIVNSVGLLINIFNQFALGRYYRAIFTKTGLAGAFFFWYAAALVLRLLLGGRLAAFDAMFLALPLLVLFMGEPLYHLLFHIKPVFREGVLPFVMEGFVEIMEAISYYLSNSISFLRVAAFALSHAVLSLIVFRMSELMSELPGGAVYALLVIIIGNALIILLEGLIVSIQVVRLQYYEFFSKFFTDSGLTWKPFSFELKEHI